MSKVIQEKDVIAILDQELEECKNIKNHYETRGLLNKVETYRREIALLEGVKAAIKELPDYIVRLRNPKCSAKEVAV